jgi:hypothetical protein
MSKTTKQEDLAVLEAVKSIAPKTRANICFQEFRRELSSLNKATLKSVIKDLSSLRDKGTLNDEEFSELIAYVCSVYVENEVEERFRRIFANKLHLFLLA